MNRAIALVVTAGCGTTAVLATPVAPPPPPPAATAGQVVETTTFEPGAMHLRIDGTDVALAQLPLAEWLGLPVTGTGSIHVDLRIPVTAGARDYSGTDGTIAIECTACQLGNDVAKLHLTTNDRRTNALIGDGIDFGHVAFDHVAVDVKVEHGQADLRWTTASPDVDLVVTGHAALAPSFDDSVVEGCIRFAAKPALEQRDSRTAAVVMTTGAPLAPDGKLDIRLAGPWKSLKRLGQICDGSQPLAPVEAPPERPTLPEPPVADNTSGSDDVDALLDTSIKKIDDHTYEIDHAVIDKLLDNPMALAKGARVVPAMKNGKPDGFKLYAIRPSSLYARIGLMNGDTLERINGFDLTSADKALEIYTKLRDATAIQIELVRRGKPVTLDLKIR